MISDLIEKADQLLKSSNATDEEILSIENTLSTYLEALATHRISENVQVEKIEEANRILREIRRERNRRAADISENVKNQPIDKQREQNLLDTLIPSNPAKISYFESSQSIDPLRKFFQSNHDPEAERLMDEAEEAFYNGNYQAAIPLYEKVMRMEPGWVRAKEHHTEAEEYLRSGNIPSVALPPVAGKAYGKAQSAARVFRYQVALKYLDDAFDHLQEAGINRWREGEELRHDLENQMQAYDVYKEGLKLLSQGELIQALGKIQTAASAVAIPEYIDKAAEIRNDVSLLEEVSDVVSLSGKIPPAKLADSKSKLERLRMKYGIIPQISRLQNRLDVLIPATIQSLTDNTERLKKEAQESPTLAQAIHKINKARENLDLLRQLDAYDSQSLEFENEITQLETDIQSNQDEIDRANETLKTGSRLFSLGAFRISSKVRSRFPNDSQVIELKRSLTPFYIVSAILGLLLLIMMIFIITFSFDSIGDAIERRNLAKTPTVTFTPTITLTPTITPTPSKTFTPTPDYSPTPTKTMTPTPIIFVQTTREIYARNDCFEGYRATGKIPAGATLTLLPMAERRFDNYNRECLFVEFRQAGYDTVTGYVLLADVIVK